MVGGPQSSIVQRGQRRNERRERSHAFPEEQGVAGTSDLIHGFLQLLLDPLRREPAEVRCTSLDGRHGGGLDLEPEARRETDAPERAQTILGHPAVGITNRAHDLARQVILPAEGVAPLTPGRTICDRVDREVAAGQVVVQRGSELHDRMTAVGRHVAPERRHLMEHPFVVEDADRPELDPDGNRSTSAEHPAHLLGSCRGRDVPVLVRNAQEGVPHAAADAPGLVASGLQLLRDIQH
jgi:hypothetical protein